MVLQQKRESLGDLLHGFQKRHEMDTTATLTI
jgi:hypothetical protein